MKHLTQIIALLVLLIALQFAAFGQYSSDPHRDEARPVLGTPYKTGPIRVILTDEETGGPYANKDVRIRFYWQWDVTKHTGQTERMSTIRYFEVRATSDEKGFVRVPAMITYPARPELPGAEASLPYFMSIGMTANDEKHSTGMAIFSPGFDLTDGDGIVRRTVKLYPRPKQ